MTLSIRKAARWAHFPFSALLTCTIVLMYCSQSMFRTAIPKKISHIDENKLLRSIIQQRAEDQTSVSYQGQWARSLRQQFRNPQEVLAILLLIGGDIIQKACAQLSGGKYDPHDSITPVAFSLGWVAYAFGALMSVFGDGNLMPPPDIHSVVATVGGQLKINESWVLGRLVRDLELRHKRTEIGGLRVVFYQTHGMSGRPRRDKLWFTYFLVVLLQMAVAAIPAFHGPNPVSERNWAILVITATGTLLALVSASLPQWRREKFFGRSNGKGSYVLTRGNGHSHIFVIRVRNEDRGFINVDDLAVIRSKVTRHTQVFSIIVVSLWIILLLTVGGIEEDRWYVLVVGVIGMAHNFMAAGLTRSPDAHGIPLTPDMEIKRTSQPYREHYVDSQRVMNGLEQAEKLRPGVGLAVLPLFFPSGLQEKQKLFWDVKAQEFAELKRTAMAGKTAAPAENQPHPTAPPQVSMAVLDEHSEFHH